MCVRNLASVTNITTEVESNRGVTERKLSGGHGMSSKTIHAVLQKDLNLSRKLARKVPKLLNDGMKKEQVRTREKLLVILHHHLMSMLNNIVTMDESAGPFETADTKQQSKQWLGKVHPGPFKAKVHATRKK
jgi:hypothetical protein